MDPEAWHGIEFVSGDGAHHPMLSRVPEYTAKPTITVNGSSTPFPAVTLDNWQFGCLQEVDNDVGEGFLAVSPDGTKYWLNHLIGKPQNVYREKSAVGPYIRTFRALAVMYVTRIEDRFGNSITYHYSGDKLTSVTADDGREVTIEWRADAPLVQSITEQPHSTNRKTWLYDYQNATTELPALTTVTRPDNSKWTISGVVTDSLLFPVYTGYESCTHRTVTNNSGQTARVVTITAPSGVKGRFEQAVIAHGRSYVPSSCVTAPFGGEAHEQIFPIFTSYALTKRTLSGPGIGIQEWNYAYPPTAVGSTSSDPCASAGTCLDRAYVAITGPDHNLAKHTFSTRAGSMDSAVWSSDEGKEIMTEWYQVNTPTPIRTKTYRYAAPDRGPYPTRIGSTFSISSVNTVKLETWTPLDRTQIEQQGTTFTREVTTFDVFARPAIVSTGSTLGYSRSTSTTHEDNLPKWVLGQVKQVKCVAPIAALPAGCGSAGTVMSKITYNSNSALPTQVQTFGKIQQSFTYNADGTLHTVTDGNDNTTTLTSWERGIPQLIQLPATAEAPSGATILAQVNDLGQIDWVLDPVGNKTCYTYDVMGRMESITYPSVTQLGECDDTASRWNQTYSDFVPVNSSEYGIPAGHWRQTITTGNAEKITYYDALWRPLIVRERDTATPGTTSFNGVAYDASGNQSFVAYPRASIGSIASFVTGVDTTYDALGRVTKVEQDWEGPGKLTTSTLYLPGFKTQVTNPRGAVTLTSQYLAWDQPSMDLPLQIKHPEGAYTSISRDAFGKPTAMSRHNADSSVWNGRWYAYDEHQQLCKRLETETGTTVMRYDAAGNLTWSASGLPWSGTTDCGVNPATSGRGSQRMYDARNRVTSLNFPNGLGNQTWTYAADGLPTQIITYNGANHTVPVINAYHYNNRRMLDGQGESAQQPGWYTWGLGYGYDHNGHLSAHSYPNNTVVTYVPNALGQPKQVGAYASNVSYFPNGALKQFTYGNGIVHTMTQNARLLPEHSKDKFGTSAAVLDDSYDYDQNANVAAISDGLAAQTGDRTMTYDDLDRLTTTLSPMFGSLVTYDYDVLDNLTRVNAPGRDHTYHYIGNRLELVSNTHGNAAVIGLGYDVQGNLANKNGQLYSFDYGNRLRVVNGKEWYRYDGYGRRVLAWTPSQGNILSQYDRAGVLRFQQDGRQGKYLSYLYLGGSLVATLEQPFGSGTITAKYQHTDALGSPVAVTDATRTVIKHSEYEPYGKLLNGPVEDGPGYTGHVSDAATGLSYMQQRYYDPGIGRFLSVDPVSANSGAGFNRYSYANNNPYRFTDPDGRFAKGTGWTRPGAWQKFNRAQQKAAKETAAGAKRLRSAVAAGGKTLTAAQAKFEKSFGAGTGTTDNMLSMATNLEAMSGALATTDPSIGFVANGLSGAQTAATPGADKNTAIFVFPGSRSMNVNIDHKSLGSSSYYIPVGHDSAHAALGFRDEEVNGAKAIFSGDEANRAAFLALPLTDPARAMENPDTIMRSTQ